MKFFDDYFVFSTSEKKGIFIFVCVLFFMTLFYMLMPYIFISKKYDFTEFKKELEAKKQNSLIIENEASLFSFNPNTISKDSLMLLGLSSKQSYNIINYRTKVGKFKSEKDFKKIYSIPDSLAEVLSSYLVFEKKESRKIDKPEIKEVSRDSLFNFDPNKSTLSQFQSLGLSSKQAQTIINYREKGGKFFKKEDLKKMYSISNETYETLEPFIDIENVPVSTKKLNTKPIEKVEINTSTKEQLIAIKGIGKKTAERIIKFRKKMGGFLDLSQLNDVYGLDSTIKANKAQYFFVDTKEIDKINLNTVTFKELLSHPYCDYNDTKKIINYREMHGDFSSVEQIVENNLIKAEQYRKIAKYLKLK